MKERPIIFKAEMVKAILDGSKTQTRRIIKPQPPEHIELCTNSLGEHFADDFNNDLMYFKCPHGKVGDRLWVRENFKVIDFNSGGQNPYVCDDFQEPYALVNYSDGWEKEVLLLEDIELGIDEVSQAERAFKKKTVPSIHMSRWASRINLEITDIRVERLNDISEEDARAEGCKVQEPIKQLDKKFIHRKYPQKVFMELWESINGKGSWDINPWVWVIEFKKSEQEG